MKRPRMLLVAGLASALLVSGAAPADTPPSRWDVAESPGVGERYALHVQVLELLALAPKLPPDMRNGPVERARERLEEAGAATSPDVRLRFDLGTVYEELGAHAQAIEVLRPALEMAPDHPAATEAYIVLAYAYAKLGRSREERDAYRRYIARVLYEPARATAVLNLAEAEMHLGNLEDAVARYHEALEIADDIPGSSSQTSVLALWGLAVALDRSGDPGGALEQARTATQRDPGDTLIAGANRPGSSVFFVPAWEHYWYMALAATVHAREATDPRQVARMWRAAEDFWGQYITSAERASRQPGGDSPLLERWIALARGHRDRARAQREAAEKRAPKTARTAPTDLEGLPW